MNSRDVAFVGVRLLAIFILLKVIYSLSYAGGFYWLLAMGRWPGQETDDFEWTVWVHLITMVVHLIIAVVLWFSAGPLSRYVAPAGTPSGANADLRVREWLTVAFAAVGLYVLVFALADVVREINSAHVMKERFGEDRHVDPRVRARYWQLATEMALGLVLLLGSGGLAGALRWLQTFGLRDKSPPKD